MMTTSKTNFYNLFRTKCFTIDLQIWGTANLPKKDSLTGCTYLCYRHERSSPKVKLFSQKRFFIDVSQDSKYTSGRDGLKIHLCWGTEKAWNFEIPQFLFFLKEKTLWIVFKFHNLFALIHFSPMSHFYTLRKRQKNIGFLAFSGGIEIWHWTIMG